MVKSKVSDRTIAIEAAQIHADHGGKDALRQDEDDGSGSSQLS